MKRVYFIAIGGVGVSSLAQYYLAKGFTVSGSDLVRSEITDKLKKLGAKIYIGQKAVNISLKLDLVIYSAAIKKGNPEFDQSKKLGLKIVSYAEALGELTRKYKTIAVSGAHGKSTTTAMLSLVLVKAGLDPTVIIGTRLKEFKGRNFRLGKSKLLIIEADEYNRSFLNYNPDIAIITNIDREHLDTYGNLGEIVKTFAKYFGNIKNNGVLIINKEDKNSLKALKLWSDKNKTHPNPPLSGSEQCIVPLIRGKEGVIKYGQPKKKWPLRVFGDFNQMNAEAVWQAAKLLRISERTFKQAVSSFSGSWRRMEELISPARFNLAGNKFYSDYAHHPTEIKATIGAFKQAYPKRKLVVVFEAHQAERLNNLFVDFVQAFDEADELILLPVYHVAGREIKKTEKKDVLHLFKAIQKRGKVKKITYLSDLKSAFPGIKKSWNSVIVFMGAGSIDLQVRQYFKSKLIK